MATRSDFHPFPLVDNLLILVFFFCQSNKLLSLIHSTMQFAGEMKFYKLRMYVQVDGLLDVDDR